MGKATFKPYKRFSYDIWLSNDGTETYRAVIKDRNNKELWGWELLSSVFYAKKQVFDMIDRFVFLGVKP